MLTKALDNAIRKSMQNNPTAWNKYKNKQWVRDVRNRANSGFATRELQRQQLNMEIQKTAFSNDPKVLLNNKVQAFKNTDFFRHNVMNQPKKVPTRSQIQPNNILTQAEYQRIIDKQKNDRKYIKPKNVDFDPRNRPNTAPDAQAGFGWKTNKTPQDIFGNIKVRDPKVLEEYYKEYSRIYGY